MAKLRDLKKLRSTIGLASVSSQISQARKPMTATMPSVRIRGEDHQSASLPLSSMTWSAPTQITSRAKPTRSTGTLRVGVSRLDSIRQHTVAQTIPTGRLIRNIHGQVQLSE